MPQGANYTEPLQPIEEVGTTNIEFGGRGNSPLEDGYDLKGHVWAVVHKS